jgi:hypothetical protein
MPTIAETFSRRRGAIDKPGIAGEAASHAGLSIAPLRLWFFLREMFNRNGAVWYTTARA